MKFAYADPPYLGLGKFYAHLHPEALTWDDPETHRRLIARLCDEFPDGWAMSLHSPALKTILPMCPEKARVAAWCKPFCAFKKNVNPAYAWEPVIFMGGRKLGNTVDTVRDWCTVSITLQKGLVGAKPKNFAFWIFELLGMRKGDELVDLFPGTGGMTDAWVEWTTQLRFA
jgi:hypothetical protein